MVGSEQLVAEALVSAALAAFGDKDLRSFMSYLSPKIRWEVHASSPLPYAGIFTGFQGVEKFHRIIEDHINFRGLIWNIMLTDAGKVVMFGEPTFESRATGTVCNHHTCVWFGVNKDKITSYDLYTSSGSVWMMLKGDLQEQHGSNNTNSIGQLYQRLAMMSGHLSGPVIEDFGPLSRLYGPGAYRDAGALLAMADPLVEWTSNSRDYLPLSNSDFTGTKALASALEVGAGLFEPYYMEVLDRAMAEDTMCLRGKMKLTASKTGLSANVDWFQALTLRKGRLSRVFEVVDSLAIRRILGLPI